MPAHATTYSSPAKDAALQRDRENAPIISLQETWKMKNKALRSIIFNIFDCLIQLNFKLLGICKSKENYLLH